jgi:hypothetical protein
MGSVAKVVKIATLVPTVATSILRRLRDSQQAFVGCLRRVSGNSLNKSALSFRHYRERDNPVFVVFPGFRLALTIAQLARNERKNYVANC